MRYSILISLSLQIAICACSPSGHAERRDLLGAFVLSIPEPILSGPSLLDIASNSSSQALESFSASAASSALAQVTSAAQASELGSIPSQAAGDKVRRASNALKDTTHALVPAGYSTAFTNLGGSVKGTGYIGHEIMKSYDTAACAAFCNHISLCQFVNIFIENIPVKHKAAEQVVVCALFSMSQQASHAKTTGTWAEDHAYWISISGSNGYSRTPHYDTPAGWVKAPFNAAINPQDSKGVAVTPFLTYSAIDCADPRACASACDDLNAYDKAHPDKHCGPRTCLFFNMFSLYLDGNGYQNICSFYMQAYSPQDAKLSSLSNGKSRFVVEDSAGFQRVNYEKPNLNCWSSTTSSSHPLTSSHKATTTTTEASITKGPTSSKTITHTTSAGTATKKLVSPSVLFNPNDLSDDFDLRLDNKLGYLVFDSNEFWSQFFPGTDYTPSTFTRLKKRGWFSRLVHKIKKAVVSIAKNIVTDTKAIGTNLAHGNIGGALTATVQLLGTVETIVPTLIAAIIPPFPPVTFSHTFDIDLPPASILKFLPGFKYENTPFGQGLQLLSYSSTQSGSSLVGTENITLYCIDCEFTGTLALSGTIQFTAFILSKLEIEVKGPASLSVGLGVWLSLQQTFSKNIPLFATGLSAIEIPGIFSLGPNLILSIGFEAQAKGVVVFGAGVTVTWAELDIIIDFRDIANSLGSQVVPKSVTPYVGVTAEADFYTDFYVELDVGIGITVLKQVLEAVALGLRTILGIKFSAEEQLSIGGPPVVNSCQGLLVEPYWANQLMVSIPDKTKTLWETTSTLLSKCISFTTPAAVITSTTTTITTTSGLTRTTARTTSSQEVIIIVDVPSTTIPPPTTYTTTTTTTTSGLVGTTVRTTSGHEVIVIVDVASTLIPTTTTTTVTTISGLTGTTVRTTSSNEVIVIVDIPSTTTLAPFTTTKTVTSGLTGFTSAFTNSLGDVTVIVDVATTLTTTETLTTGSVTTTYTTTGSNNEVTVVIDVPTSAPSNNLACAYGTFSQSFYLEQGSNSGQFAHLSPASGATYPDVYSTEAALVSSTYFTLTGSTLTITYNGVTLTLSQPDPANNPSSNGGPALFRDAGFLAANDYTPTFCYITAQSGLSCDNAHPSWNLCGTALELLFSSLDECIDISLSAANIVNTPGCDVTAVDTACNLYNAQLPSLDSDLLEGEFEAYCMGDPVTLITINPQ